MGTSELIYRFWQIVQHWATFLGCWFEYLNNKKKGETAARWSGRTWGMRAPWKFICIYSRYGVKCTWRIIGGYLLIWKSALLQKEEKEVLTLLIKYIVFQLPAGQTVARNVPSARLVFRNATRVWFFAPFLSTAPIGRSAVSIKLGWAMPVRSDFRASSVTARIAVEALTRFFYSQVWMNEWMRRLR